MLNLYKPSSWRIYCIFLILIFSTFYLKAQNYPVSDFDPNLQQVIAFPGAEGFGKYAIGGRGGQVIKVTNLNDSGPGSLRDGIEAVGPRIIVFEVSGTIELKSEISVRSGNLTVAGQTAPGDGITLKNYPLVIRNTNNVILRYIRSRMGDLANFTGNALSVRQDSNGRSPENVIIDHCSFSWGTDETMSIVNSKNITIQNCIITEGLNSSVHKKGEHGYGGIISGQNISVYNNLISHFVERNFQFQKGRDLNREESMIDFRNNVVYNWSHRASDGGAESNINMVHNYYKAGPASSEERFDFIMNPTNIGSDPNTYGLFYLEGNKLEHRPEVEKDQWVGVGLQSGRLTTEYLHLTQNRDKNGNLAPFPIPEGIYSTKRTANQAYQAVTNFAGASLKRDAVDARIVQETRNGKTTFKGSKTGLLGIIDSQKDVGGWPVLKSLPAPVDSDGDGIPDAWEIANNLDPKSPNDREYNLSPYYTDIEVYINSLVQDLLIQQNPGPPSQVELALPSINESISPVELSFAWKPVVNATDYRIQISKNSDFSSNVITISNIKTFSLVYPELDANSTYFWRVRASNSVGNGTYSTVWSFKTSSKNISPSRTLLLSPENQKEDVSLSPVFHWAKVPNTDSYQIQIATTSDFSNVIVNQSNLAENEYPSPKLNENSSYFWRVRARNGNGTGSYSAISSFKTPNFANRPKGVVPISPVNQAQTSPLDVNLKWEEQATAEYYQVQIATDHNFSNVIYNNSLLTGTNLKMPYMDPNSTYYWRIRGRNRSGYGNYSSVNQFQTLAFPNAPQQVQLISPENDRNIFDSKITFQWAEDPVAQSYRLQLSTSPNFNTLVSNIGGISGTTRTVTNLSSNTLYYWRVIARNETGDSPASETRLVRSATYSGTPPATSLVSPADLAVTGASSIELIWENQPNTENYRLEISEQLNFSSLAFSRNSIKGTRFTVTSLNPNKTYYWRVRTSNPAGNGGYTAVWSFSTVNQDVNLIPPVLVSPNSADHINDEAVSLSWQPVPEADGYEVQVAENINFSNISFGQINLTGTNFAVQGLKKNVAYFWRVRAKLQGIHSAWSEIRNFSTGNDDNNPLLNNGLVGYWPMDEGSGNRMMDQSGKGNHATIVDANGISWKKGVVDKAISLNGNSGRLGRVSHNNSLAIPKALTISAWVKPSDLGRNSIISKADSDGNGFELWLDLDGQIEFRLNRGKNGTVYRIRSNFNYSNQVGKWFHVAATFDGTNSIIYINGKEDISRTYALFGIGTNSGNLVIGAIGNVQRFRGEMDELRLYERALNEFEIPLLMGEQASVSPPSLSLSENLEGHWKMDEGSGNLLIDHSGNRNDATIITYSRGIKWVTGVEGLALNLDGGSGRYGSVAHNSNLVINDAISIAAWVNPNLVGRNTVISKSDGNGFELTLNNDGIIEFYLNRDNSGTTYRLSSFHNYSKDVGNWIHVAATFDGSNSKIYINGVEDVSGNYSPFTIGTSSGNLSIAALGTIQRFKGSLDDLRLYSRSLSFNEIQQLASNSQTMRMLPGASKNNPAISEENSFQSESTIIPENRREDRTAPILYPNPVEARIQVMSLWQKDGMITGQVYDMRGVLLLEQEFELNSFGIEFDISHLRLKAGNYLLILQDMRHREVLRFIKK